MSFEGALTALSQPATTLIEKISSCVGILYEPTRIRRNAEAQADADKILAISQLEIADIQKRALTRFVKEETIKQRNIESVIGKAIPAIEQDAKTENVDNDWLVKYFEKVRYVTDDDMQNLWAKILAGECNNKGSFSKMTLNVVDELDKDDAILFSSLCSTVFSINNEYRPLIYEPNDITYTGIGINYGKLLHLESLGLISFNSITGYTLQGFKKNVIIDYFGTKVLLEFANESNNDFSLGVALFTQAGKQLFPICGSVKNDLILEKTLEYLKIKENMQYFILNKK